MKARILTALGLLGALALASAQTIPNPRFESNSLTAYPGYIRSDSVLMPGNPNAYEN